MGPLLKFWGHVQTHRASKRNAKRERREAQQKEAALAVEAQASALRKAGGRGASPSASPAPEVGPQGS